MPLVKVLLNEAEVARGSELACYSYTRGSLGLIEKFMNGTDYSVAETLEMFEKAGRVKTVNLSELASPELVVPRWNEWCRRAEAKERMKEVLRQDTGDLL